MNPGINFAIAENTTNNTVPDVAYNSDENTYLVVWSDSTRTIMGGVVNANGTLEVMLDIAKSKDMPIYTDKPDIDNQKFEITRDNPAVTYSASAGFWLVTCQELNSSTYSYDIKARSVTKNIMGTIFTVCNGNYSTSHSHYHPDVSANDVGGFLVV